MLSYKFNLYNIFVQVITCTKSQLVHNIYTVQTRWTVSWCSLMTPPLFGKQGQKNASHDMGYLYELVTKYQIPVINSCLEKCDEKWAYMFNVYKNQLSRQTGSRNLTGPKTLPTIWYTYMTLVTKYQISALNSYWEKCDEKYLGRTEGRKDGRTDRRKTVYPPSPRGGGGGGYKKKPITHFYFSKCKFCDLPGKIKWPI